MEVMMISWSLSCSFVIYDVWELLSDSLDFHLQTFHMVWSFDEGCGGHCWDGFKLVQGS